MPLIAEALTDVATVRSLLDEPDADQARIETLINGYSRAIASYTAREFTPTSSATRELSYRGNGFVSLTPWELRSASSVTISISGPDGPDSTVYAEGVDFELGPRSKTQQGTYLWLDFYGLLERRRIDYLLTVAGAWGMAEIPEDVALACATACVDGYRNPEGFADRNIGPLSWIEVREPAGTAGRAIPPKARALVDQFARWLL